MGEAAGALTQMCIRVWQIHSREYFLLRNTDFYFSCIPVQQIHLKRYFLSRNTLFVRLFFVFMHHQYDRNRIVFDTEKYMCDEYTLNRNCIRHREILKVQLYLSSRNTIFGRYSCVTNTPRIPVCQLRPVAQLYSWLRNTRALILYSGESNTSDT